jgi:hypothetical protein
MADQITFQCRTIGRASGGDEAQAIHLALRAMSGKLLRQYEADDGPLTADQLRQIKMRAERRSFASAKSALFVL